MKKKILSIFLASLLALCFVPTVVFAENASVASTDKTIVLGTNGISGYSSTDGYDYIYYGNYNDTAVKWRVLDTKTNTGDEGLFLLSESILQNDVYFSQNYSKAYQGSDAQAWCKDFAGEQGAQENVKDAFTAAELDAIIATVKSDEAGYFVEDWGLRSEKSEAVENILNGDKVFCLSIDEIGNSNFGFDRNNGVKQKAYYSDGGARNYWLRSCYYGNTGQGFTVSYEGWRVGTMLWNWSKADKKNYFTTHSMRPGFNLNTNRVLYSSNVNDVNNEWKLTVIDKSRGFDASIKSLSLNSGGGTASFSYSDAKTGENEYVSAMLIDSSENVLRYSKIKNVQSEENASGDITFEIPAGLADGTYTIKLFNEQNTETVATGYASSTVDLQISVNNGIGTISRFKGEIITVPILKVDEKNYWCVSYDQGKTWNSLNIKAIGTDGLSPHIDSSSGHWFVGDKDTGIVARGDKGDPGINGITPMLKIDKITNEWYVSYDNGGNWASLGVKATGETGKTGDKGADGQTPYIGINGNWWIGITDTGVKAQGAKGDTGETGAQGEKGDIGDTGATGRDGKDGLNGQNGRDGKDGIGIKKAEINADGELVITYTNGKTSNLGTIVGEDGKDGLTPFIGENGNWWIGEKDTGVKASAEVLTTANSAEAATSANSTAIIVIGIVAGLALLSNIGLIAYIFKKRKFFA